METKGKKIILGSNSPRRRELLGGLDVDFTVDTGNTFTEEYDPETPHERIPEVLSEGKSFGFYRELANIVPKLKWKGFKIPVFSDEK